MPDNQINRFAASKQKHLTDDDVSIVIVTYGRHAVLVETISRLLQLQTQAKEIVVVDQNPEHDVQTQGFLTAWHEAGKIRLMKMSPPSIVCAMNKGLLAAMSAIVLFLDDDVIPDDSIVACHKAVYEADPAVGAVVGQVLQPGEKPLENAHNPVCTGLHEDLDFRFNSTRSVEIKNAIGCNFSCRKDKFILAGGFDERHQGAVFRFETELAWRFWSSGSKIVFEPKASIKHLQAPSGGTRAHGSHLTSASPVHGAGDYYFALRHGHGFDRLWYIFKRPFRQIRTKFHLRHPWYIPVKLIGELRAVVLAFKWWRQGPILIDAAKVGNRQPKNSNQEQ